MQRLERKHQQEDPEKLYRAIAHKSQPSAVEDTSETEMALPDEASASEDEMLESQDRAHKGGGGPTLGVPISTASVVVQSSAVLEAANDVVKEAALADR